MLFQEETYAILQCASLLKTLEVVEKPIYICTDSLIAIRSLHKPRITSKLTRECKEELNELAERRPVCFSWVSGHAGILATNRRIG